jgi:hypothetical protein
MDKIKEFLKKLYRMRIKVQRKGVPVLNWSVLFSALCVIFATRLSLVGVFIALIMGYEFSFESESADFDTAEINAAVQKAVRNVSAKVNEAARTVKVEIEKSGFRNETKQNPENAAAPAETVPEAAKTEPAAPAAAPDPVPEKAGAENEDLLSDLERHADDFQVNPAATTYHSAYSAMANSVPVIDFPPQDAGEGPAAQKESGGQG